MLALAGVPLGLEFVFYDRISDPCARHLGRVYTDHRAFAEAANIYTYESENAPRALAARLAQAGRIFPSLPALLAASDRIKEKQLFHNLNIPTARWRAVHDRAELEEAARTLGFPSVLKTVSLGYDGKGQIQLSGRAQLAKLGAGWSPKSTAYIAEERIAFKRELSQLSVRTQDGAIAHYPPIENQHENGILYTSKAPAVIPRRQQEQLQQWTTALMTHLDYVGVLALELFDCGDRLLANEFAPRVHNSGHWTIEGATTSQFANHLRAICGLPLGQTDACGHAIMLNCVGQPPPILATGFSHHYGKTQRPGRKLGHITYVGDSTAAVTRMRQTLDHHPFTL